MHPAATRRPQSCRSAEAVRSNGHVRISTGTCGSPQRWRLGRHKVGDRPPQRASYSIQAWRALGEPHQPKGRRSSMAGELAFLSRARTWEAFYAEARVAEFRRRLYLDAFGEEYPVDEAS